MGVIPCKSLVMMVLHKFETPVNWLCFYKLTAEHAETAEN